ncbi:S-layer homology domain-containing protein [Cohnella hashimotonis]|uniref:S-layer homology domain-containing protein n=1 Tax=Cohnella hashimotonis TaxID=2826895 RepID=A0ABT6TSL8_9BACL|nr:S-layer homology domain-containing protein [Cohnella hashimotonis]MDI4649830.1 S-layer homology domain-containing protein [Cohnella hashimotonis]
MGYSTWKRTSKRMLRMSVMFLVCTVVYASLIGNFGTRIYAESAPPHFEEQPQDATINAGQDASFTAVAGNYDTLQWQVDTGSGFADVDNTAPYDGVHSDTLSITAATIGMSGYKYRLVASNTVSTVESDTVTLTVNSADDAPQPTITLQPADQTMNVGDHASITLVVTAQVSGGGVLSYQWYRSDPVNGLFALSGKTGASLTVPTTSAGENDYYVVVTNTDTSIPGTQTASVTSRTAKVKVNALAGAATPKIDTQPTADTVVDQNDSVVLHVEASLNAGDSGTLSYQWYRSDSASADSSVQLGGKTSDSFTVPTGGSGVFYYFVVVTNTDNSAPGDKTASVASAVAKVTVNALANAAPPTISTQPADDTVDAGDSVVLHVAASGSGSLSYQWYRNDSDSNAGGFQLANAIGDSFTVPTGSAGVNYYYVIVTNTDASVAGTKTASVASNAAKITVNALASAAPPTIGTEPADDSVDVGDSVILHVAASGTGTLSYQWYRNDSDSTSSGVQLTNATSDSFTVPTGSAGVNYYYVVVTNTDNSVAGTKTVSVASRAAKVTVNALDDAAAPTIGTEPADDMVDEGDSVVLHVVANGTGTLSYQWYRNDSSSTTGGFQLAGATSDSFTVPTGAAGVNYYYVVVTNTDNSVTGTKTASVASRAAKVTVNGLDDAELPTIGTEPADDTVDEGGGITLHVAATLNGSGQLSYQWYRNDSNSTIGSSQIMNATGTSLTVPTADAGVTYYYAVVTNTDLNAPGNKTVSVASRIAKVTVNALENAQAPVIDTQTTSDQTVNEGDVLTLNVTARSTDGGTLTYQWYRVDDEFGNVAVNQATNANFNAHSAVAPGHAFEVYYYYPVVTNTNNDVPGITYASVTGEVIKVTVYANAEKPVFLTHPKNKTVNEGGSVTLKVEATVPVTGVLTYQWYRNTTNSTTDGTLISGATDGEYAVPTDSVGVTYYYAVATNTDPTALGYKVVSTTSAIAKVTVKALTYSIAPIADQTADELVQGYAPGTQQTKTISIANTGTGGLTNLAVSLSGEGAEDFVLTQPASTLESGSPAASFTVKAKDGLAAGTHTATVTIKAEHLTDVSFQVTQVVHEPPLTYSITPIADQTATELVQGYASGTQQTKTISIANTGTGGLTNLAVSLSGEGAEDFVLTQPASTLESGSPAASFTVAAKDGLAAGTHTATVTIKAEHLTDVSFQVTQVVHEPPLTYSIAPIADQTATELFQGYASGTQQTKTISIANTGTGGLTNLAVSLSGEGAEDFVLTQPASTLESGSPAASFTVKAKDGLAAGTHTATVTIKAEHLTDVSFQVTQVVHEPPLTYSITPIADQTATELFQGYASGTQQTKTISIANTGTGGLTNLAVSLSGEGAEDFVLTQPASTLESGSPAASFTVTAKDGLAAGTYTATVTITADHLTDVSFTVIQVVKAPENVSTGTGQPASTNIEVLVNGKAVYAGSATTSQVDGRSVTTVTLDPQKLAERLAVEGTGAIITIPVAAASDRIIVAFDGQAIQNLEQKRAVVELQAKNAIYNLPVQQVNFSSVVAQFGANIDLRDVKVLIEIAAPTADVAKIVENAATRGNFSLVVPPISFTVKLAYGDKTVEVTKFNSYVERKIALPEGSDHAKITTGIVVEPDGTVRHVPSKVTTIDGKDYVVINSLTNSTYAVVWNPLQFSDVAVHWAKDSVNDMGSRMVIGGTGDGLFSPDRDITRAEFAAIVVRGLGLKLEDGTTPFSDAGTSAGYSSAINTAFAYNLISGFEDGTFRPNDKITREQAMVIIAKAMKATGLSGDRGATAEDAFLSFADASSVATWAIDSVAANVQAGLVKGRTSTRLDPKAYITRAEVAAIVQRLLQKSDLI